MLPRGEYRQIESDQNADPNVGRKRMRLTEGSTSLQGISYADVFGTAQEQATVPDILKPSQEQSVLGEEVRLVWGWMKLSPNRIYAAFVAAEQHRPLIFDARPHQLHQIR